MRDAHGLHADGGDAGQQVDDFFLVIGEAVGVEFLADGRVLRFLFFVLVEDPFQRATIAELVFPRFGRDAVQAGFGVQRDYPCGFVGT